MEVSPGVRLQIVSNLHFEVRRSSFRQVLKPSGDILLLAGDIGYPFDRIFEQFLYWCSLKFPFVIFVPGECEYYGSSLSKGLRRLKKLCKKYGIYLLEKDLLELPEQNLVILGTTLWSEIPHKHTFEVLRNVEDYHAIQGFSFNVVDRLHSESKKWLSEQIEFYKLYNPEYHLVVVTHHAPEIQHTTIPGKKVSSQASDCSDLLKGVFLWVYGHTGYNNTFSIGSTTLTSNQRGCSKNPVCGTKFSKEKVVVLR